MSSNESDLRNGYNLIIFPVYLDTVSSLKFYYTTFLSTEFQTETFSRKNFTIFMLQKVKIGVFGYADFIFEPIARKPTFNHFWLISPLLSARNNIKASLIIETQ